MSLLAIGILGNIFSPSEETTQIPNEREVTEVFPSEESTASPKTFKVGDTFVVDFIAFRVDKVTTASKVGKDILGTFMGVEADGIFYIIELTIENRAKESKNIFMDVFKIVDDQGRSFDPDAEAEIYYEVGGKKAITFGDQLQPGLPITGVKIFDLPKTAKGLKLEIECCGLITEKVYIDLGI